MALSGKTFGDFYDAVYDTALHEPPIWMEEWVALVDDAEWKKVRAAPLSDDWVISFAHDMVIAFQKRMFGICTEALYAIVFDEGKAFLQEITEKAHEFGVDVSAKTDVPITPSDAVARAYGIEVQY